MFQDPSEHDNRQIDEILSDPQANAQLRLELAATVDAGKPMVESTYILKGMELLPGNALACQPVLVNNGEFTKPRRQQQRKREHHNS